MAIYKTLIVLSCLLILPATLSQGISGQNNGQGNTGGGINGQLNGRNDVTAEDIRRVLPQSVRNVIGPSDDSNDRPSHSEPVVRIDPVARPVNTAHRSTQGRGNNNGNNNSDGKSRGNNCNTNNNGNNNQGGNCGEEPVVPAPRVRPSVDTSNDRAPRPRVDTGNDRAPRPRVDTGDDRAARPTVRHGPTGRTTKGGSSVGDIDLGFNRNNGRRGNSRYFNYNSIFSNSRLANLLDYRYWLNRYLPRFSRYTRYSRRPYRYRSTYRYTHRQQ